jgi:hypothetical protein
MLSGDNPAQAGSVYTFRVRERRSGDSARRPEPSKVESMLVLTIFCAIASIASAQTRQIPRTWDEKALVNWATPVAGLNVRPHHLSEKEYYATPVDNLRTYPVYYPDREPAGYWEKLQKLGPQPLSNRRN